MNPEVMWILGGLSAGILGFLAIWKLEILTYLYDVRLTPTGLAFCVFSVWTVYVLPYTGIESVDVQKRWGGGLFVYNFKNRLFKTAFLVRTRSGWFTRRILITPPSPEEFIRALDSAQVRVIDSRGRT
jgi:hypothetical protein